ncbi:MAG TPA: ATP-dependent DNA helicase [Verrucomicrobiae bacterium]|jgi:DNA helicase-2/ATP-dependent DNA helicase PcrA|nr:ATP-dependent DNA helicase [Verrucomicrobiae bacterium]
MDSLFSYPATPAPGFPLNPEQRAAAHHGEGPLVVVAGAGTGKTRVITERIRYLLDTQPELTGKEILGLTFTDKAAAEMKHRVVAPARERGEAEAGRAEAVTLSTFHAFCNNLLLELDPDLKPIDNIDHWILLRRNLPLLQLEHYRRLAEPGQFLGDFVEFFSRCQDELVTPDNYQRYAEEQARAFERVRTAMPEDERAIRDEEIAKALEIARAYRASDLLLRERKLITFGTQILDAVQRLKADASLRERLRARYRYILVDEFQDTNIAQLELLWLLGGDRPNLVVVGDHRQAIYRFRGASFGSFTIFLKRFASGAAAGRDLLQPLTRNYRSSGRILRVAGQAIRHNEKPPNIPEYPLEAEREDGEKVRIVTHESSEAEAHWVAGELERLHGAGARWRAFAVLYRSHGHRDKLVEALKARQIPFVIKNLSILSHRLVRDVIAYLRLIDHPSEDVACARVLAMPAWGLAPADLVRLTERAAKTKGVSLWDTMLAAKDEAAFSAGDRNLPALVEMITELRKKARQLTAVELFDELAEAVQISAAVADEDRKYFDRLAQFLRDWQPKSETQRLKEFVEYLDYFEQAGGAINLEQESGDAVQLMTVHAAKGLEFDHVYVLRLVQRSFPAGERPHVLEFPPELMKEEQPQGSFHIQEERRLFYVAVTRAQRRLTLNTVVNKRSKPSVFLDDILMDPQIKRRDVQQVAPPAAEAAALPEEEEPTLFDMRDWRARVGSRIGEWATSYRPPVPEPLTISPSAMGTLQACAQKYLFSGVWKLRCQPAAAMSFGSVMHNTIKYFIGELVKGRTLPFEEVERKFQLEWTSAGFEDDYQEQEYKKDGLTQLRAFYERTLAAPPEVIAQEKVFQLPMDNSVVLTGRMDQVNRLGPGQEEIVDYKTGKPRDAEKARKDLQLSAYALAAREVFDWNPARLTLHFLQNDQPVSATRDEKQLKKVCDDIQEAAADIRAGEFPANPGFACKFCDYESICPAREQGAATSASGED